MNGDILEHVFSFMEPGDIVKCEMVCKSWREVAIRPSLWKKVLTAIQPEEYKGEIDLSETDADHRLLALAITHPMVVAEIKNHIHVAAFRGDREAFEILRIYGDCSYDERDLYGRVPIQYASMGGHYTLAEDLFLDQIYWEDEIPNDERFGM